MLTLAAEPPGFCRVRKSFSPERVSAPENPNKVWRAVAPSTSVAPATLPVPKLWTTYWGRSATIGTSEVTSVETPWIPGPTPFWLWNTSTVRRLCGLTVTFRVVTVLDWSTYRRVTWAVLTPPGFWRVRYSLKPGNVVPSAKFHWVAGALAPNATWPSLIGPEPKLKLST